MTEINAEQVRSLRERTGAGMMECKKALTDAGGNAEKAILILRERGAAGAAKKAGRTAKDGSIVSNVSADGRQGVLVEVNCETDFVARNEDFKKFTAEVARLLMKDLNTDLEKMRTEIVAKTGENVQISRREQMAAGPSGRIGVYIHTGSKVGVMLEIGAGKPETTATPAFSEVMDEIAMQIAASKPACLAREEVPAERVAEEKSVLEKQVDPKKPPQIREKIVEGRLGSFYEQICLLEQGYIREPKKKVRDLIKEKGAAMGDAVTVRRFVRFDIGE